jgi:DNA-binding transcriptional LysR family regulator
MGMVAQTDAIALIPEMMLRTAGFGLISRPLEPRQYRTIGLASPPHDETPVLVRTFAAFCREYFEKH